MGKIKQFITSDAGKDTFIVIIVILVGLGSFELGRLSKDNDSSGIQIEYLGKEQNIGRYQSANVILGTANAEQNVSDQINANGKNYFASSRGSKYYSVNCSAGKTIKQENRVYFGTGEEAEQAGYTLSTSCN